MASFSQSATTNTGTNLPQEIIDLIIDEVARHGSPATLKACSLVSKSFCLPSRKYLFSDIDFLVDASWQTRAAKLIKVLQHNDNTYLFPAIRSFNVTFDMAFLKAPYFFREMRLEWRFLKSKETMHRILRKLGMESNHLLKLLDLLSHRNLECLSLSGLEWFDWNSPLILHGFESSLSRICSSDFLRTLHLSNIRNVPKSLLVAAITSRNLCELGLSFVFFDGEDPLELPTTSNPKPMAMLEKLELTYLSYSRFFGLFRSILGLPTPPVQVFPRLRAFRTSSRMYGDWQELGQFVIHSMPSLDTLEFIQRRSTLDHMIHQGPSTLRLHQVPSLRHLKFIVTCYEMGDDFLAKQKALARFFSAQTSPTTIISVVINLYAHLQQVPGNEPLTPNRGWAALDEALTSPVFSDLRTVVFNVRSFRYISGISSICRDSAERLSNVSALTPLLTSCAPRLEVEIFWSLHSVPIGQSLTNLLHE